MWLYRISISYKQLRNDRATKLSDPITLPESIQINILLPVLDEDVRLKQFATYFNEHIIPTYGNIHLWIITTQREVKDYKGSNTIEIAKKLASGSEFISHIHYPKTNGVMAHQLNYAIETIDSGDVFAIYNADSQPEPNTFKWVAHELHRIDNKRVILQQFGFYTKNIEYLGTVKNKYILIANAHWQTRWSLGSEYYRAVVSNFSTKRPKLLQPFNYCIGHGLFMTKEVSREIRLSELSMNEDCILGIEASIKAIPILPIPYFDISDSPDSVYSIYSQKSNWFQGPFQSGLYYSLLKNVTNSSVLLLVNCVKMFMYAVYWIAGPLLMVVLYALAIYLTFSKNVYFILFILTPMFFIVLPALFANQTISKLQIVNLNEVIKSSFGRQLTDLIFGGILAYAVHGAAGTKGLIFHRRIVNRPKQKTEMSEYKATQQ